MAEKKTFKFKNPNTGIISEYNDTPYFRKMTARIQKKYDNLSAKDKATIKERIEKRNERQSKQDKMRSEVREGRAAGLSMHEIRAKRMNISPEELSRRNLATVLGMAEGMSMFLPAGAAIRGGMLVYKGLKGAKAARALKAAANAKKAARTTKTGAASKRMPVKAPRTPVKAPRKPVKTPRKPVKTPRKPVKPDPKIVKSQTRRQQSQTKLTPKGKKLVGAAAVGTGFGLTALGLAGKSIYDSRRASANQGTTPKVTRSGAASKRMPTVKARSTSSMSDAQKRRQVSKSTSPTVSAAQKKRQTTLERGVGRSTLSDAQKKRQKRLVRSSSPTVSDAQKKRQTRLVKSTSTMSDAQKRRATRITAGPNVGFGPKGNIFPKDAADRRRLMAKYGGTGSAAARAAAQGKQGNMKKGSK